LYNKDQVKAFFRLAYGPNTGLVCIAFLSRDRKNMDERFFEYPTQLERMLEVIEERYEDNNVYYCPQLFGARKRIKENVISCPTVWADLDLCPPNQLLVLPSVLVRTSPGRTQALWRLEEATEPLIAEAISKRIAYYHADVGADRSGWDLTQLLRVPGTHNFKYQDDVAELHIYVEHHNRNVYREADFIGYPDTGRVHGEGIPMPEKIEVELVGVDLIQTRRRTLNPVAFELFGTPPANTEFSEDWSKALWKLIMILYEAGFTREEVFTICNDAACNKYRRDGRNPEHLWKDVIRGFNEHHKGINTVIVPEYHETVLMSDEELELVSEKETFVERYIEWASGLGDAATQYHQAGAFIILSALLSGKVALPTSFGTIVPNLWFMILADTTLTRKSTAMDIATDLLIEVDPDAVMATDGSVEGLMTGLSMRPGRPSIFLRDEFTGLIEAMTKKDYMAGMPEMLTKLYDGKYSKRMLRKEPIEIKEPILILFAGGIKNRTQQLLTLDHISSGFMPRFLFLTAESDVTKVRPTGPPVVRDLSGRNAMLDEMNEMYDFYHAEAPSQTRGIKLRQKSRKWNATLTPEAWARFNKFEGDLLAAGVASDRPDILTPTYARLTISTLKAALLLAAASNRDEEELEVTELYILMAIRYAMGWREYAIDVINGVGKSGHERDIERTLSLIKKRPGISRSSIMQHFHLTAQTATSLFATMEQRGLIQSVNFGRGTTYKAIGSSDPDELTKD